MSNQRLHANAAIALLFHVEHHRRGVGKPCLGSLKGRGVTRPDIASERSVAKILKAECDWEFMRPDGSHNRL